MKDWHRVSPAELQRLGRYEIQRRIGRGGMGEVWLCRDPRLKRQVAIKTLPVHSQQDHDFVQRFEHEAQAAASLNHPHIVQVHDYDKQALPDGSVLPYIVMPYMEGGSLSELIAIYQHQNQLMPPREALILLKQAAEAIDYAHTRRVVHRDIKPANMLLRDDHWLVLADFGIARMLTGSDSLTQTGYGFGTPEYMAPEQAQGQTSVTSDNYSLAVIAYQLFTGRLPFQGETAIATTMQHLTDPPPSPDQFAPWLPAALGEILLCGMAKDPEQRPALACEFVAQLERALNESNYQSTSMRTLRDLPELHIPEHVPTRRIAHWSPRATMHSRRSLLIGAGLGAALLLGVGTGLWGYLRTRSDGAPALPTQSHSAHPTPHGGNYPELQLTGGHVKAPYGLVWSPDSQLLFSSGSDGLIFRWDILDLMRHPEQQPLYHGSPLRSGDSDMQMDMSPTGKLAISNYLSQESDATDEIAIVAADLHTITGITLEGISAYYFPVWLTDDYLLCGTGPHFLSGKKQNQRVYVVDTAQPNKRQWIIKDIVPDSQKALNFIVPYRSSTHLFVALCTAHSADILAITIANQVAWETRATIQFFPHTGTETPSSVAAPTPTTTPSSGRVQDIAWSADGRYLIALLYFDSSTTRLVVVDWQADQPEPVEVALPKLAQDDQVWGIACTSSGATNVAIYTEMGLVYLIDIEGRKPPIQLEHNGLDVEQFPINTLSWSPDGQWLAASCKDNHSSILVWRVQEGK